MNIRKNIDYSQMYAALDELMAQDLPQMELYCSIGRIVCTRSEKGAAVMASEYLIANYPDAKGFSPRSLRRMRDFYRTYENNPALLSRTMKLGWIQNVVIMEAGLRVELREWYMKAAQQFGWSKTELTAYIAENAHEDIVLSSEEEHNEVEQEDTLAESKKCALADIKISRNHSVMGIRNWWKNWKKGRRRWCAILWEICLKKQIVSMRC